MRHLTRPRIAQILLLVVVGAMFLPWASRDVGDGSTVGVDVDEGRLAVILSVLTIALIQVGLRPAWIGAGFVAAMLVKQILDVNDQALVSPGVGLWLGMLAAAAAAVVLVWEMVASVERRDRQSS